jgi:hypothetical protein
MHNNDTTTDHDAIIEAAIKAGLEELAQLADNGEIDAVDGGQWRRIVRMVAENMSKPFEYEDTMACWLAIRAIKRAIPEDCFVAVWNAIPARLMEIPQAIEEEYARQTAANQQRGKQGDDVTLT